MEISFFQSQMDESTPLEEIRTWEHPPWYGIDQFKEKVILIFLENQKGHFHHFMTHFRMPVKRWMIFGPCQETLCTAITLNQESNFIRREKNHSLLQTEQEMEDSIGLQVVNGLVMVEFGNSQKRRKRIAQILEWKFHQCTRSFVQCCRNRVQRTTRFPPQTWRWIHDSYWQQQWSGNEDSFWEIGELTWQEWTQLIPVYLENNIFNVYLNREVKSTETHNVDGRAVRW